jgi:hypothetical protein
MSGLSDALHGALSPELIIELQKLIDKNTYSETSTETVTTGAMSVAVRDTYLSVDGTKAFSLADGTFVGQLKRGIVTVGTNTPLGTITPTHPTGFATVTALGGVGDFVEFIWNGTAWRLGAFSGVTLT